MPANPEHGAPTFCFNFTVRDDGEYQYVATNAIPPICVPAAVPTSGSCRLIVAGHEPLVKAGLRSMQIRLSVPQITDLLGEYGVDYDPKELKAVKARKLVDYIFKEEETEESKIELTNAICGTRKVKQDATLAEAAALLDSEETPCFDKIIKDAIRTSNEQKRNGNPHHHVDREVSHK